MDFIDTEFTSLFCM